MKRNLSYVCPWEGSIDRLSLHWRLFRGMSLYPAMDVATSRSEKIRVERLDCQSVVHLKLKPRYSWVQAWLGQTPGARRQSLSLTGFPGQFPVRYWNLEGVSVEEYWTVPTVLSKQWVGMRHQPHPCQGRGCHPGSTINSPQASAIYFHCSDAPANTPLLFPVPPAAKTLVMQL